MADAANYIETNLLDVPPDWDITGEPYLAITTATNTDDFGRPTQITGPHYAASPDGGGKRDRGQKRGHSDIRLFDALSHLGTLTPRTGRASVGDLGFAKQ